MQHEEGGSTNLVNNISKATKKCKQFAEKNASSLNNLHEFYMASFVILFNIY